MSENRHPETPESGAVRPAGAAELLDVSRNTIYELMASGELPSFKIGRGRRIRVSDISDYMDRQLEAAR